MDVTTIPADAAVTRFPPVNRFPLEHEVVRMVDKYLRAHQWPYNRIPCRVEFGSQYRMPSQHGVDIEGRDGAGAMVGRSRLWFNVLYLHQRPGIFLVDVVAHETAHLLAELEALAKGATIDPHGVEWQAWLSKLSHRAAPSKNGAAAEFDDRALRLAKGGVTYKCECPGVERVKVFPAAFDGDRPCKVCKAPLRRIGHAALPSGIREELEFIRSCQEQEGMYGWLC